MVPRPSYPALDDASRWPEAPPPASAPQDTSPHPYLDYGRVLTDEGGILIQYKDHDLSLLQILWRILAWSVATGAEGEWLMRFSPLHDGGVTMACLVTVAIINLLIVAKAVEVYRQLEVRPDCLILDGTDMFWARQMEEWPTFRADPDGNQVLSGTYGTRSVEFLTVRRFDEFDRAPEVFAAHLKQAMQQLWSHPF